MEAIKNVIAVKYKIVQNASFTSYRFTKLPLNICFDAG